MAAVVDPSYRNQQSNKETHDSSFDPNSRLEYLNKEIEKLNGGQAVNCASHKQVAFALFGTTSEPTNKAALKDLSNNPDVDMKRWKMASLVLECRSLRGVKKDRDVEIVQWTAGAQKRTEQGRSNGIHTPDSNKDMPLDWNDPMSYDLLVEAKFANVQSRVDTFWKEPLLQLARPTSRALLKQLSFQDCPMGYDPAASPTGNSKKQTRAGAQGSFLSYCRQQKVKHPNCIILTRCGDFYESFGIDAILLMEHCGLNAMGGKARAGCPYRNVQWTLDCLTEAGFRVAVYEEGADSAKNGIKDRFLSAFVSPASPTYLYDLVLLPNSADALSSGPQSRPYVGILASKAGYTLAEVSVEEQNVRISERLTAEAVACRISAYPPADPVIYVPAPGDQSCTLPFLPSSAPRIKIKTIPPHLVQQEGTGLCEIERAKQIVLSEFMKLSEGEGEFIAQLSAEDFTLLNDPVKVESAVVTSPLYVETATQLGLMDDKSMPCLVSYLLPAPAPAASKRFLRRLLLTPPPPAVGEAISTLVAFMKASDGPALPPFTVPPLGKVLSVIRAKQASAEIYSELLKALQATILVIDLLEERNSTREMNALMTLLEYESGMASDLQSLRARCKDAIDKIHSVLCPSRHVGSEVSSDRQEHLTSSDRQEHRTSNGLQEKSTSVLNGIPQDFIRRNEEKWRGRIKNSFEEVSTCAERLAAAVHHDFNVAPTQIVQDVSNNIFALKAKPGGKQIYIHPVDRFGKQIGNRYTTEKVRDALSDYVSACEKARKEVTATLVALSQCLHDEGHIPAVVQASHANLILATTFYHAVKANSLGWDMAEAVENIDDEIDTAARIVGVWPYWMDKTAAVNNTFDLSGMWVLTAPNMSGKSTIMRSTAAASLLTMCGLCAPLGQGSLIRRFDNIFVRGASADIPTEGKSAFGAEMGDVAALLRSCGKRSLVFVDELGRGTSPKDGTRLAAAVLEAMAGAGMSGVFATHLHGIVSLPIKTDRIVLKRMAVENEMQTPQSEWTYRLEDGLCTDSMALATALRFGLPQSVIDRAEALYQSVANIEDSTTNSNGSHSSLGSVKRILKDLCDRNIVELQPFWIPPASFDGKTTLYVLELASNPKRYYVGETDNIRQRLKQHRAKGEWWEKSTALLIRVEEGKTTARSLETSLIRRLAREGVPLQSVFDGRTTRTGRR